MMASCSFEAVQSSALMHVSAVKSLLSALRQLSSQCFSGCSSGTGQGSNQQIGSVAFCVERMTSVIVNNLPITAEALPHVPAKNLCDRPWVATAVLQGIFFGEHVWDAKKHIFTGVQHIWDDVVGHLVELSGSSNQQLRNLALDSLDQSICAVLGSDQFQSNYPPVELELPAKASMTGEMELFECAVLSPLIVLYTSSQILDVRAGALKILLHVLERHGEKLHFSWSDILNMLRSVAGAADRDLIPLGFQSIRVIMNDGLSTMPVHCIDVCIDVTGAYAAQKTEINISLTAIGLLWIATDFIAKGLLQKIPKETTMRNENGTTTDADNLAQDSDVFSILQKLGSDERPEVRIQHRTLFQILGSHGQKISKSVWENCLWTYVFPVLESVSFLAATSSRDEWQGKELGVRGGKAVHMLIHHSRNTAQKQWDETLVLVLGGITRLLRSFFPFLQSLSNFSAGWETLIHFIEDGILNGSKEVAVAALSCLQTVVSSHCPKEAMGKTKEEVRAEGAFIGDQGLNSNICPCKVAAAPRHQLVLVISRKVEQGNGWILLVKLPILPPTVSSLRKAKDSDWIPNEEDGALEKERDLYVQAQSLFNTDMYWQLLIAMHLAVKISKTAADIHKEIDLLFYLLGSGAASHRMKDQQIFNVKPTQDNAAIESSTFESKKDDNTMTESQIYSDGSITDDFVSATMTVEPPSLPCDEANPGENIVCNWNHLFMEKLIPVIIELFLEAPGAERCNVFPEMIQGLGRCMNTRRDNPGGSLWRVAVEGFNRLLIVDLIHADIEKKMDPHIYRQARARLWKEIADVYEIFLVGSCGRALSSDGKVEAFKADELIDMNVLNVLTDKILKGNIDAPVEILQRLVSALDHCASRTGFLPVESLELIPSHCSRFSLRCLQILFSLCSFSTEDDWTPARLTISNVSIDILIKRCEFLLKQILIDENKLGEHPLPAARTNETIYVLQELIRMVIHSETSSVLNLPINLKVKLENSNSPVCRSHLLVLFPSFSELVTSRESRIRELVQVLLRLVAEELGLCKSTH
ncbi:hypothetical protein HPP92_012122 [Vanilla planifolia]|uniref:Protein MON2 homolog n=1 Tax=Vanilla planifolia TaxID=51239 RepID=A0A835QYX4_VANPL|nr:hypothetical protein HPP92_012122 [Vanilla planifolia]